MTRFQLPIVITGSNLTSSALRWNIEFLGKELKNQFVRIFVSSNRQFRYHNMKFETTAAYYEWQPPFRIHEGLFQEFIEMTNDFKKADNGSRAYFQYLINELNLTESMDDDFNEFNWNWIHDTVLPATKWGQLKHNLLLVGMNDVSTPVHFDGMENLFSMARDVDGQKHVNELFTFLDIWAQEMYSIRSESIQGALSFSNSPSTR